jgi:hypothetical protein
VNVNYLSLIVYVVQGVAGENAADTNRQGIEKAQLGKLDEALELFQRTVKYVYSPTFICCLTFTRG